MEIFDERYQTRLKHSCIRLLDPPPTIFCTVWQKNELTPSMTHHWYGCQVLQQNKTIIFLQIFRVHHMSMSMVRFCQMTFIPSQYLSFLNRVLSWLIQNWKIVEFTLMLGRTFRQRQHIRCRCARKEQTHADPMRNRMKLPVGWLAFTAVCDFWLRSEDWSTTSSDQYHDKNASFNVCLHLSSDYLNEHWSEFEHTTQAEDLLVTYIGYFSLYSGCQRHCSTEIGRSKINKTIDHRKINLYNLASFTLSLIREKHSIRSFWWNIGLACAHYDEDIKFPTDRFNRPSPPVDYTTITDRYNGSNSVLHEQSKHTMSKYHTAMTIQLDDSRFL